MTKFKKMTERKRAQMNFDREKITVKMAGKEINVYDFIQAGREDTEIYPVLEKYGCIDKIKRTDQELYADITAIQKLDGLRGIVEQQRQAKEMFEQLPMEIRKEFNNSLNEFSLKAPEYLQNLAEKIEKKDIVKTETSSEVNNNE